MGTLQTVNIPSDHFARQTTNIYTKPLEALLRELVQNSKDAGADTFTIDAEPDKITITDNGCGMSEEVLKKGMLTMSGSIKNEGATGGFGAAKELILFAQESYEIETNNIYAYGSCLSYMLDRKEFVQGTKITIVPHELFDYRKSEFEDIARVYLQQCKFDMRCSVNGIGINQFHIGDLYRELPWSKIYSKSGEPTSEMKIMHNGLLMFKKRTSEMKNHITIELKGDSTNSLTTSRDSLRYSQGDDLDSLVLEMQQSQGEFGKLYNKIVTYQGKKSFIQTLKEEFNEIQMNEILEHVPNEILHNDNVTSQIEIMERIAASASMPIEVRENIEKIKEVLTADIEEDFKIRVDKNDIDTIPEEICPGTMKKKYEVIVSLWKAAMIEIGNVYNDMPPQYNIGFILSDDSEALFTNDEKGMCFYINPYSKAFHHAGSDIESIHNLIVVACHEVAHSYTDYHGNAWQNEFQRIIVKFFANSNVSAVRKLARTVKL